MAVEFTVTNVLGEIRNTPSLFAWTDETGDHAAYTCPFCGSAVDSIRTNGLCENPACSASKWATVEVATINRDKAIARDKETAERKRNHEFNMSYIREDNARRMVERNEFDNRVQAANGCLRCSSQHHNKIRKHRLACPKAV